MPDAPDLNRSRWGTALLLAGVLLLGCKAAALAQGEAEALSARFREASKRVLPAVVTVRGATEMLHADGPLDLFGRLRPPSRDSGGSGVVVDAEGGFLLTNDHVVEDANRGHVNAPLVVLLPDGEERPVVEVRRDPKSDLALLVIEPGNLTSAAWGDSEALEIGDWVLAVGQPFGLSGTVTAGIISGKGRAIGVALYEDLLQTDAAINPGNSGGPLVNLKGEVVGINVAIKTIHGGHEGVGFAVPAWRARRVADDLAEHGRVRRVYLGLGIGGTSRPGPVPITSITVGGPAERAGLRPGDLIVALDDRPVEGSGMLMSAVEFAPAGEPLTLTIRRDDQEFEVEVRPQPQPETFGLPGADARPSPGLPSQGRFEPEPVGEK
ncbi:N/A [soil metagenome]